MVALGRVDKSWGCYTTWARHETDGFLRRAKPTSVRAFPSNGRMAIHRKRVEIGFSIFRNPPRICPHDLVLQRQVVLQSTASDRFTSCSTVTYQKNCMCFVGQTLLSGPKKSQAAQQGIAWVSAWPDKSVWPTNPSIVLYKNIIPLQHPGYTRTQRTTWRCSSR